METEGSWAGYTRSTYKIILVHRNHGASHKHMQIWPLIPCPLSAFLFSIINRARVELGSSPTGGQNLQPSLQSRPRRAGQEAQLSAPATCSMLSSRLRNLVPSTMKSAILPQSLAAVKAKLRSDTAFW